MAETIRTGKTEEIGGIEIERKEIEARREDR